jgi:hypothetical protein
MATDYIKALSYLYPGAEWSMSANDYATLEWHSVTPQKPTRKSLDDAWPEVQTERELAAIRAARHAAYAAPDGPDAIFLQWQRGDATEQDWLDAVQAVKDQHPYPDAPKKK